MTTVQSRILDHVAAMSPAESRVAEAILAAYPALAAAGASEIARAAGASTASVARFVTRLGFAGFKDFNAAVRADLDTDAARGVTGAAQRTNPFAAVSGIETRNITSTLNRLTVETVEQVRETVTGASEVAILGGRLSHVLALYLHAHLQLVRSDVTLVSRANVPDQIAHYGRGVCLIAFDFPRYHPDAEHAVRYVKGRRGRTLVMTDPYLSPAAQHADFTLIADVEGSHPTVASLLGPVALIDAIVIDVISSGQDRIPERTEQVQAARDMFWGQMSTAR